MATEGATGPDGKKNTVTFENHPQSDVGKFMRGNHPSQQQQGATGPAGATAPATGPAGATGPATGPNVKSTGPTVEELFLGKTTAEPDYKKKVSDLEAELQKFREKGTANPYIKNPKLYKLQVIEDETPDQAPLFHKILFGSATSEELWKEKFLMDHPQYKDKPEEVQLYLEQKYSLLFDADADKNSREYKFAKMEFDLEADGVRTSLQNRLDGIQIPPAGKLEEDSKEATNALATAWTPEFAKVKTGFEKLSLNVPITDKTAEKIEVIIPVEEQQKYLRAGALFVLQEKLPAGDESVQKVSTHMRKLYIADHVEEFLALAWKQASEKMDALWVSQTNNSSKIKAPAVPNAPGSNPMEDFVKQVTKQ